MRFAVSTTLMAGVLFGATVMPAAAQQASLPFPSGAKYAYVDLARILGAESVHGRTANAQVQQLTEQKRSEIEARQAIAADPDRLQEPEPGCSCSSGWSRARRS